MAGINNIAGSYNINPKRVSSKLSFEVGQVFSARVIGTSDENKNIMLRLMEGWQFPAELEKSLEFIPQGLIKFQVEGFQEGKLQLKIINDKQKDKNKTSLEDLILDNNMNVNKEDIEILKNMIKHNMPLTKENIAHIKSVLGFKNKIFNESSEEDKFISRYAAGKNIDLNSEEGKDIEKSLKGFFRELKGMPVDDIFTMLENGLELNEENIKSFNKLVYEDSILYEDLKSLEKELNISSYNQDVEIELKEQLSHKLEELKAIIKNAIKQTESMDSEGYKKIFELLKGNINDIKVFNTISNQYYYMDIPVQLNSNEYGCKLMIKDDRKSGKRIDSKNVSLVISVNTVNIGIIDSYIKVREHNMNIDLRCEEQWIKLLSQGKNIILKEIANLGYNVFVNINKREKAATLSNCQEFFQDSSLESINIRV
jgi:hypothetical protein